MKALVLSGGRHPAAVTTIIARPGVDVALAKQRPAQQGCHVATTFVVATVQYDRRIEPPGARHLDRRGDAQAGTSRYASSSTITRA